MAGTAGKDKQAIRSIQAIRDKSGMSAQRLAIELYESRWRSSAMITQQERDLINQQFQQSDCDQCGKQISSARQIAKPGTQLCDKCAKVDLDEEER